MSRDRLSAIERAGMSLTQTWRDVQGWPYQVSDEGHVYSERRQIILSPYWNQTRTYRVVDLRKDGERRQAYVHRLILESFYPEQDTKETEAHHQNSDSTDNRISNLEWIEKDEHADVTEQETSEESLDVMDAPF